MSAKFVAKKKLNKSNTPAVFLINQRYKKLYQKTKVKANGSFSFSGLSNGQYTLQLYPGIYELQRGGYFDGEIGGYYKSSSSSSNKPWEKVIIIKNKNIDLGEINLHKTGLLPGILTGVVFNPKANYLPFSNAFGYICLNKNVFDSVGGSYYLIKFMTDGQGRFKVDACPPGKYILKLTNRSDGYIYRDPSVQIHAFPEKVLKLQLFAPKTKLAPKAKD